MKRILAMLCVIACLCGLCVPALAAGNITVSVQAPADWAEVYLYVWETDPMAGWPGTAMTKGADGWWTLEIPAGSYTNVIANNGEGKPQTADLKMDGSADCWIKAEAGAGAVYTDAGCTNAFGGSAPSTPSTPSGGVNLGGLNSLALVGTGIPGVGEWNPGDAAGDMTKVSDGVYSKVITVTAGTSMTFKIAGNDAWDDNYNFGAAEDGATVTLGTKIDLTNGGGSKDIALTAAKDCNLKFTVDLSGDVPTLLVEETDEEADTNPGGGSSTPAPGGPTVTVYAKVPADWTDVRVWAWNDAQQNATSVAWPGDIVMTKGDDGWYSAEVPQGYPNLLINAKGGTAQTADIAGALSDKPIYIDALTNPAQPTVHNEKVDIAEPDPNDKPAAPIRPLKPPTENNDTNVDNNAGDQENASNLTVVLAIVGSVVIIAVAAVLIIVLKKKK